MRVIALGLLAAACSSSPGATARSDAETAEAGTVDAAVDAAVDAHHAADLGPDAAADDAASDSGGDADVGPDPVDPDATPPPAFSDEPGMAAAAAMVGAWQARPSNEAEAQANAATLREATATLVAEGPAAADRIAAHCTRQDAVLTLRHQACARLLMLVESDAALDYLEGLARLPDAAPDPGRHDPPPSNLTRAVALSALGVRAERGSERATERLLSLVEDAPDENARRRAAHTLLRALPRHRIKRRLAARLPPEAQHLLYEVRR